VQILFSHFHMDHLFGFPFFVPIYSPNCKVHVTVPAYGDVEAMYPARVSAKITPFTRATAQLEPSSFSCTMISSCLSRIFTVAILSCPS
jgi:phosphoribosyl 1,2-cyclic phosphodiesterase